MKTEFELEVNPSYLLSAKMRATAKIIGKAPKDRPYVAITLTDDKHTLADIWIQDKDLRLFAKNILKALGDN